MNASSSSVTSPIALATAQCLSEFRHIIALLDTNTQPSLGISSSAVQEELGRFQIWAGNLGAFQPIESGISLDYRLRRDGSKLSAHFVSRLTELEETLRETFMILSGKRPNRVGAEQLPDASAPEAQTPVEISEVHELFQWTSEIITTLFRLSVVIRNATTRDRYAKAIGSYPAFTDMLKVDLSHVASKFPRIGKDEKTQWLVHRLGHAITRRRQFLYYQRRHRNTMGQMPSAGTIDRGKGTFKGAQSVTGNDLFNSAESLGPATTTASTLDISKLDQQVVAYREAQEQSDGMSSHATSIASGDGDASRIIVTLANLKTKGRHFECPYCRDIQDITTDHSWRKHVFQDLRPYVCTFENCDSTLFADPQSWIDHEQDAHRFRWICDFCNVKPLRTEGEFSHHLLSTHKASFTDAQLPLLLKVSRQAVTEFSTEDCPLCYAHDLDKKTRILNSGIPPNSKVLFTPTQFYAHLGSHMKGLSLFAIPSSTMCEDFDELEDVKSNDSNIATLAHDTKASDDNTWVKEADSKLPSNTARMGFSQEKSEASSLSEFADIEPLTEEDQSGAIDLADLETALEIEGTEPVTRNDHLEVPERAEGVVPAARLLPWSRGAAGMMRIAVAGSGGLARTFVAHILEETTNVCLVMSREPQPDLEGPDCQVTVVDYEDQELLRFTLRGIDLVVSTVSGNPQINLIDAAAHSGVRRFVPAEFEGPPSRRPQNDPLDRGKAACLQRLRHYKHHPRHPMPSTIFSCGVFYERFARGGLSAYNIGASSNVDYQGSYLMDIENGTAEIVKQHSDGRLISIAMTSINDVARFLIATLEIDLDNWPNEFRMSGDRITVAQIIQLAESTKGVSFYTEVIAPGDLAAHLEYAIFQQDFGKVARMHELIATEQGRYDFRHPNLNALVSFRPETFGDWIRNHWGTDRLSPLPDVYRRP